MSASLAALRAARRALPSTGRWAPRAPVSPCFSRTSYRTFYRSSLRQAESPLPNSSSSSTVESLKSTAASPKKRRRLLLKTAQVCGFIVGSVGLGLVTFVGVLFIHDAFTYTSKHTERVPVSPLALHPELGGPKNLPIAKVLIDDDDVSVGSS